MSAGSRQAAEVAARVLRAGGNPVDAVIAGSAMQCVVEMPWCGIGGDAFAVIRTPDGAVSAFNGSGVAPARILDAMGSRPQVPRFGPVSIAVPAIVDSWAQLHGRHGSVPLGDLLEPARRAAADGVTLDERLAGALRSVGTIEGGDQLASIVEQSSLEAGATFRQPDLAGTIASIARDGRDGFYTGAIAIRIAAHVTGRGGALSADDLAAHAGEWVEPLSTEYRGNTVHTNAPVSSGALLLVYLRVLEAVCPEGLPADPVRRTDLFVRLKRLVYAEVAPVLGDPRFSEPVDVLDDASIKGLAARLRADVYARREVVAPVAGDTTSIAVAGSDGTSVSFIHSLFNEFGARELVPGTGVVLNDRLANLVVSEGGASAPNSLVPGKRPTHTLHCYLVERPDGVVLTGATPGGRGQVQTNAQVLTRVIDDHMSLQDAVTAPRWLHGMPRQSPESTTLYVEPGLAALAEPLRERGHRVEVLSPGLGDHFGNCTVVAHRGASRFTAAADHRRAGHATAW